MSAAFTLPYVWATADVARPLQRNTDLQPLGGLVFYRKRTEALLRRYMRMSMDMGRAPSVLGEIVFRGRASSHRIRNFEDAAIFVIDMERCLKRLDRPSQELVADCPARVHAGGSSRVAGARCEDGNPKVCRSTRPPDEHLSGKKAAHSGLPGKLSRVRQAQRDVTASYSASYECATVGG
jgi:hypothetical protein